MGLTAENSERKGLLLTKHFEWELCQAIIRTAERYGDSGFTVDEVWRDEILKNPNFMPMSYAKRNIGTQLRSYYRSGYLKKLGYRLSTMAWGNSRPVAVYAKAVKSK